MVIILQICYNNKFTKSPMIEVFVLDVLNMAYISKD